MTGLRPADIRWSGRFPLLWVPRSELGPALAPARTTYGAAHQPRSSACQVRESALSGAQVSALPLPGEKVPRPNYDDHLPDARHAVAGVDGTFI